MSKKSATQSSKTTIPAGKKTSQKKLLHRAVIENIRKPQTAIEEARAISICLNAGETKEEAAEQYGCSVATIENRLKLLELPPAKQRAIKEGTMTASAGLAEVNGHATGPKMRKRKEVQEAAEEYREGSDVRAALEWLMGLREKIS